MLKQISDVMIVWELRGGFPEVPIFADVDIAALTQGDNDPFYVTLPIGEADVTSRNKNYYDGAFVAELARQTQARKPVGIMGHLSEEKIKNMDFPDEAVHWVGAKLEGNKLWGKAYVVPGAARDRVRRYKATNRPMATSIYATMGLDWDSGLGAYRAQADTLDLMQIDLGPVDRAGVPSLGAVPIITRELVDDKEQEPMDKLQIIREMTAEDAALLPKHVRDIVVSSVPTPPEVALVAELRTELGDGDIVETVKEWKRERVTGQEERINGRIRELVTDKDKGVKVESIQAVVTELVQARRPQTTEAAETAFNEVVQSATVTELLKAAVISAGGPPLRTGLQPQGVAPVDHYFPLPSKKESA